MAMGLPQKKFDFILDTFDGLIIIQTQFDEYYLYN